MAHLEIERKFLLKQIPEHLLNGVTGEEIRQGYLIVDAEKELRIRQRGNQYWMTLKQGSGLARQEEECAIPAQQFNMLWPLTGGRQVEKVRYCVKQGGLLFEIDVFHGTLEPLQLLEVEFSSIEGSQAFSLPDFVAAEVTEDKAYKNANLALNGRPQK